MTAPTPDIDIVIVSFNTRELLRRCLDSINKHAAPVTVHSIVVDNASHDGSADMVAQEFPQTRLVVNSENLGFGAANNRGTAEGEAPLILFLNSDAELTPGALAALAACLAADANAVIAGPALQNSDGSWQPSLRRFPTWGRNLWLYSGLGARFPGRLRPWDTWLNEVEHRSARTVDMVSGACFLARRQYMDSVGGFDENLFFYEEELDLSLPARRAGKTVRYCPEAHVIHHGGASVTSSGMSSFARRHLFRGKYYVFRKHYGPRYARATYASDVVLFALSLVRNSIWGNVRPARALLTAARRGWRESFRSAEELRAAPEFWGGVRVGGKDSKD